jgi:hypothetical protein
MKPRLAVLALALLAGLGLASVQSALPAGHVEAVAAVGMTVSDMDRAIDFYSSVLSFETVSDVEVTGPEWERLRGVFGLRMRVVRLRLGAELIER